MSTVQGWKTKRIHEIGMLLSGSTPSTTIKLYWDGDIVWVTPYDLSRLNTPYFYTSSKKIYDIERAELDRYLNTEKRVLVRAVENLWEKYAD